MVGLGRCKMCVVLALIAVVLIARATWLKCMYMYSVRYFLWCYLFALDVLFTHFTHYLCIIIMCQHVVGTTCWSLLSFAEKGIEAKFQPLHASLQMHWHSPKKMYVSGTPHTTLCSTVSTLSILSHSPKCHDPLLPRFCA